MLAGKLNSVLDTFKTKYPALIGVDISSTAIKLVELVEAGKGAFRLERYAIEPLVRDVVTDGNIANLDQVAEALRRAWKRLGSRNRNVALELPAAMVITKKITNTCQAESMVITITKVKVERSSGTVICLKRCQAFAPSTTAAS